MFSVFHDKCIAKMEKTSDNEYRVLAMNRTYQATGVLIMRYDRIDQRTATRFLPIGYLVFAIAVLTIVRPGFADEADATAGIDFFETRIRPVLAAHCYKCHSDEAKSPKGGLRVDTRDSIRRGGESGHAVIPGKPDASLLMSALRYEEFAMPPSEPLDESVVDDFETWIRMGAPDPRDRTVEATSTAIDLEKGREFWAFQSPTQPTVPENDGWGYNEIDRFLAKRRAAAEVVPVKDADPAVLLRRVYFDLTGLPPSPEAVVEFVNGTSPDAFARVVDKLLDSPRFGERWGRHWLDVVRFAESTGRTRNFPYPFAWRYRDYVIRSFNQDKPYDQFIREQLAGDLLPAETDRKRREQQIATGFLAMGAYDLNERNSRVYRMDIVGDQIDVASRSIMGVTLGCARCHDHKFDPFPTRDYYALAGIFRSTDVLNGYTNRRRNKQYADPELLLRLDQQDPATASQQDKSEQRSRDVTTQQQVRRARDKVQRLTQLLERKQQADSKPSDVKKIRKRLANAKQTLKSVEQQFKKDRKREAKSMQGPYAMGVSDANRIADLEVHQGGDVDQLGDVIPRGYLQVVHIPSAPTIPTNQSGRLELAEWLTHKDHPLTSRVFVNRVWHHLFGQGIVRTVDNFGQMGARPTHPVLLDYLATRFVADGWSIKSLIRSIVLSRAYQLSGESDPTNLEVDPDNSLVWRVPMRRLEAEAIRDAVLAVSGELNTTPPASSVVQKFPIAPIGRRRNRGSTNFAEYNHRSVYLPIVRSNVPGYLRTFDFPEPSEVKGNRDVTTVATQALFMMNSPLVADQSRRVAQRLLDRQLRPRQLVEEAYLLTVGRLPTEEQLQRVLTFAQQTRATSKGAQRDRMLLAVTDVVHALIASAEFRYR